MCQAENLSVLGHNIEELLYRKRKQQTWLAQKCDVTPSHINQIIKGKTKPSLQVLRAMATALEVTTDEIMSEDYLKGRNISYGQMD